MADFYLPPTGDLEVHEKAVEWFARKLGLTAEKLEKIKAKASNTAATAVRWQRLTMAAEVLRLGKAGIESGASVAETKEKLKKSLAQKWSIDVPDNRLETTVRTNQQSSYGAARWEQIEETKTTHSYIKFSAILDKSTTPTCVACNGTVLPVAHPFWVNHKPPLHFNCRSTLVPMRETVAKRVGISPKAPDAEPDEGFGDPTIPWKPDKRTLPRSLVKQGKKGRL